MLAVQTLSRLNRAHPQKADTFVLDFADNAEAVKAAFQTYYRATIQDGETDPNKLHDLKAELDDQQVYSASQVDELVAQFPGGADRDRLDPIPRRSTARCWNCWTTIHGNRRNRVWITAPHPPAKAAQARCDAPVSLPRARMTHGARCRTLAAFCRSGTNSWRSGRVGIVC